MSADMSLGLTVLPALCASVRPLHCFCIVCFELLPLFLLDIALHTEQLECRLKSPLAGLCCLDCVRGSDKCAVSVSSALSCLHCDCCT